MSIYIISMVYSLMKVEIMTDRSIVEYFGLGDGHSCGYCGNSDTNISHGIINFMFPVLLFLKMGSLYFRGTQIEV